MPELGLRRPQVLQSKRTDVHGAHTWVPPGVAGLRRPVSMDSGFAMLAQRGALPWSRPQQVGGGPPSSGEGLLSLWGDHLLHAFLCSRHCVSS